MTLNQLFEKFQTQYGCCLDIDDFSSVLVMYPASLVALADGEFSQLERENIINALKESASGNDFRTCEMYRMLCKILELPSDDKVALLKSMNEEIADRPEIKKIILELMISTAESDNGISKEEKTAIDLLKNILSL